MLVIGMLGQAAGTIVVSCPPLLIPYLYLTHGVSLVEAGLLAASPSVGVLLSLVVWGAIVDRFGERISMATGLGVVTVGAAAATLTSQSLIFLAFSFFIAGIGAASTNSASGRLVVGWFEANQRGLAMGIRQTALPLGLGFAALLVPNVVEWRGLATTIAIVTAIAGIATVITGLLIVDPPRPDRDNAAHAHLFKNPYRTNSNLLRIHVASALLVIPQFTVWTYLLLWLVDTRGWQTGAAAAFVAIAHVSSGFGRIGAGWWSDRLGSRLLPMRVVAAATGVVFMVLGFAEASPVAVGLALMATVLSVSDNGLAFTAVAEIAGPQWSGRAFGLQNTGQYLVSALVPPTVALLISSVGYAWVFAIVALFPLLAIALIPIHAQAAKPT